MTKAKFKVTDDMVDAAWDAAEMFTLVADRDYDTEDEMKEGFIKAIIQAAADQWLQTKGGGYVSLGDYNSVSKSYTLLYEEHGDLLDKYDILEVDYELLQRKYKDLELDNDDLSDELTEIKGELYKRGIKL